MAERTGERIPGAMLMMLQVLRGVSDWVEISIKSDTSFEVFVDCE